MRGIRVPSGTTWQDVVLAMLLVAVVLWLLLKFLPKR